MKLRLITTLSTVALLALSPLAATSPAFARHGADDTTPDDRGRGRGNDDGPNHTSIQIIDDSFMLARRGADDPAGDDKGRGRGNDDGPNHT